MLFKDELVNLVFVLLKFFSIGNKVFGEGRSKKYMFGSTALCYFIPTDRRQLCEVTDLLEEFGRPEVQQLASIFIRSSRVKPFQAASLLAVLLLLLLERGMFSSPSPPPALLEKVFRYIDLHQDEFVQVGERNYTQNAWIISFGIWVRQLFAWRCGFFCLIPFKMPMTAHWVKNLQYSLDRWTRSLLAIPPVEGTGSSYPAHLVQGCPHRDDQHLR